MPKKLNVRLKEAAGKILKKFSGLPPVRELRFRLKSRRLGKHQAALGRVAYIGYVSDKWDKKKRLYHHDFERGPVLSFDPQTKLLVILPAGWRLTSRGIVG